MLLGNWRQISLLNMDVQLLSKALAYCIKKILPNIIHNSGYSGYAQHKSGYVERRFIGETIQTSDDVMEFTKCKGISGILAFLDFGKAFDSVEWNFLHKSLEAFYFGSDFKKWVSLLYTDISSCVSNNGVHISDFFALERGIRQGDPSSLYLFIAAVEILAIAMRANTNIRGISIGDQEFKLEQYADDTTGILKDEESLKIFFGKL